MNRCASLWIVVTQNCAFQKESDGIHEWNTLTEYIRACPDVTEKDWVRFLRNGMQGACPQGALHVETFFHNRKTNAVNGCDPIARYTREIHISNTEKKTL